jgi:hypothetical protein
METSNISGTVSKNWVITEPNENYYSSDKVIDAYLQGKKEGLEQAQKAVFTLLENNLNKCHQLTSKIIAFLKIRKFSPLNAYLRILSFDVFEILITIPEKEFLDDHFLAIYEEVSQIERTERSDFFNVTFTFSDSGVHFDEKHLQSDGFIFKNKQYAVKARGT